MPFVRQKRKEKKRKKTIARHCRKHNLIIDAQINDPSRNKALNAKDMEEHKSKERKK